MDKKYLKAMEILAKQEELLQFDHFNEDDAWDLTCFFVKYMKEISCPMAVTIKKMNGCVMTQYTPVTRSKLNDVFGIKKFNTCCLTEQSSLRFASFLSLVGETLKGQCMNYNEHIGCGGAFPIRVKGTGMVAVLIVSGLEHEKDHAFMIDVLNKYLGQEAPQLDMQIPMCLE